LKTVTVIYIQFHNITNRLYGERVDRRQWYKVYDMTDSSNFGDDDEEDFRDCIAFEIDDGTSEYMTSEDLEYSTIEFEVNIDPKYNLLWNVA
jgi:hypothetical protein